MFDDLSDLQVAAKHQRLWWKDSWNMQERHDVELLFREMKLRGITASDFSISQLANAEV